MSKAELLESARLLEELRRQASRKMLLSQEDYLRRLWERQALALRQGAEALRREAER